jgi:phospholipid transport system transporter-binding protein
MSAARLQPQGDGLFRLLGRIDYDSVPSLWATSSVVFDGQSRIIVELDGVEHSDSAAVALLLAWTRLARQRGHQIEFRGAPDQLLRLVELSDLTALLPIRTQPLA